MRKICFLAAAALLILPRTVASENAEPQNSMLFRGLGRTGHRTALFSLGGTGALIQPGKTGEAIEIINRAIDLGVNYIDTAPTYGNGTSEINIGRVMETRRNEVFLATKSHDYTYEGTMRLIEESLKRLRTDYVDLYQHHFVRPQLEKITAEDGALRAFKELREKGRVRYIGITSHSPRLLLSALELDVYDCMLITVNPSGVSMMDREYLDEFLEKAAEKEVGVIAMKLFGKGSIVGEKAGAEELFRYALSYPVATAIIGISETWQVDDNVKSAGNFRQLSGTEQEELRQRFK